MDGINNIYSLEFYGGNEIDKRMVQTFEDMCENNHFSRMGVLRMDVDNLGHIFQQGIAPERATLSRFAALSRSFDFFFFWLFEHSLERNRSGKIIHCV